MNKWIVILLVLGVGGFFGYKKLPELSPSKTAGERADHIATATAERKDIRFNVKAAGEIGPAERVCVRPEINGKIDELPVDLGVLHLSTAFVIRRISSFNFLTSNGLAI